MSGGSPVSGFFARWVSHSPIMSGFSGVLFIAVLSLSSFYHNPVIFKCHIVVLLLLSDIVSSSTGSRPLIVRYVLAVNP